MYLSSFWSFLTYLCILICATNCSAVFKWPNPQIDAIDQALYTVDGFLSVLTQNCQIRSSSTLAAQWIRLAYHDMSTYDASDGSGGLDASLLFELDRPQNVGQGMKASFNDFSFFRSPYVGFADTIAIGTVLAIASCGGPVIPYRGGRIDAKVAGPATVPEPHQDLQTHIDSFKRQGFNQSEMIALVACGHTLGGVRGVDFPNIINNSAIVFANFDHTFRQFDNKGVIDYLTGVTTDALVTTNNVTTRSDLRIFSSDGNVTVHSMASSEDFSKTCGNLFERMLNTVPKEVNLTEPIDPIENKVYGVSLYTNNFGTYVLRVTLRRLIDNPNREVVLFWKERQPVGKPTCPQIGCSAEVTSMDTPSPNYLGALRGLMMFNSYTFEVNIPLNASISDFWFTVDEKDGSGPQMVDNVGFKYVIEQDVVLFYPTRTSRILTDSGTLLALVVGVRTTEVDAHSKLSVESFKPGNTDFIPTIETVDLQLDLDNNPPADGYTFFTANVSTGATGIHVNAAAIGGNEYRFFVDSDDFIV